MSKMPHVMAISSTGGHWVQLMRLRKAWDGMKVTYVTTDPGSGEILRQQAQEAGEAAPNFATVTEANRWQKMRLIKQLLQITWVLIRYRPDVVVSTGAAPGYFAIRLGGLLGARTIWIDSMANAEELSLSGQKIGKHVDLWLTQWEHLARPEGPHYMGAVL